MAENEQLRKMIIEGLDEIDKSITEFTKHLSLTRLAANGPFSDAPLDYLVVVDLLNKTSHSIKTQTAYGTLGLLLIQAVFEKPEEVMKGEQ